MPSKHIVKVYAEDAYYHVFNRGVNKQDIFLDDQDYGYFLKLLKRYLGDNIDIDSLGREYNNYRDKMDLLAFCLMPNHYHLLIYQTESDAMTNLLRSVCTSYTMYFNKKYKRVGHLFQSTFKASMITTDHYLDHISRYIHLNPESYKSWPYSSLDYYLGKKSASWINPTKMMETFTPVTYSAFLNDYMGHRQMLKVIKYTLADKK